MIALLLSVNTYCQNNFSLGITQDVKLALVEDDYGNKPFTLDAIGKFSWHIENSNNRNELVFYGQHERAELAGGLYIRNGIGVGYGFHLGIFRLTPSVNWGNITRHDEKFQSVELEVEADYYVGKHFAITFLYNYTERADIDIWRSNAGVGVRYYLFRTD